MDKPDRGAILHGMDGDVLIVGGGPVGGTLALALARGGLSSVLIDAAPRPAERRFDGRAYSVAHGSMRVLRALGLRLDAQAQPILHIKVADGRPGTGLTSAVVHFDHAEIEEGPMGWMVEDHRLRAALDDALDAEPRIRRVLGEVAGQDTDGAATVRLASGEVLTGRLIAGADGRRGGTAERAGIDRDVTEYEQASLTCAVEHEHPHDATAYQIFLPPGPLAILPLTGDRSAVVWTERRAEAKRVLALDAEAYLAVLRPRFGAFLGDLRLIGERGLQPLSLVLAERLVARRVALLGDAAHGVHPVAGQGLNAGLRDVAVLAETLTDARRRGQDPGEAAPLEAYQRWRRFDGALTAFATDGFARLFSNDRPGLRLLRGAGLGAVARIPALRRAFIREAAGLTGDLPRLMRGEPL